MLRPPSTVLGTAPWRRAPLLLRRSPAVLLAVLAAGLILGAAAAATPLFLSSAASAALARQMEERCPPTYGLQVRTFGALGGPVSAEELDQAAGLGRAPGWPAGRALLATRERRVGQAGALMPALGQPVLSMSGPLLQVAGAPPGALSGGRLFYRDGFEGHIRKLASAPGVTGVWLPSEAAAQVQRSEAIGAAVGGAIGPVAIAGTVVALLLVAAAGSYWVDRRRVEVTLLAARGVGPLAIAARAVLEMLLWLTLGGVLGWLAAIALVRLLGPSDLLDASATPSALARTGVAVAAGLALLGLVAALRSRGMTERGIGVRRGVLAKVPLELAVLALAALAYQRPASQGPPVATGTEPPRIDLLLLAFPMLFLVGTVGLAVRLLGVAVRRLGTAGSSWPHAAYLAAQLRGAEDPEEVDRLLAALGLEHRAGHRPEQLSGGEQQRLAFAAAVSGGPALVVADEPTAELDTESGERLMQAVLGLRDQGTSLVVSSHDPVVTGAVDQTVRLHDGEVT